MLTRPQRRLAHLATLSLVLTLALIFRRHPIAEALPLYLAVRFFRAAPALLPPTSAAAAPLSHYYGQLSSPPASA
jgi:hypothetical protein